MPPLHHPLIQPDNVRDGVRIFGVLGTFSGVPGAPGDVAVAHDTTPFVSAYPWTPGSGFGAKYANPGTLPADYGYGVAFCGNTDVAVAHDTTPFVSAYPWTPGGGFGAKYANPGTLPAGIGRGVAFLRGGFWLS